MVSLLKIGYSLLGIVYVWSLPLLAEIGFAEKDSNSISGFIANAPATGAMAALSFAPITLMWVFQNHKMNQIDLDHNKRSHLSITLSMYQIFYSMFLTCTETYTPEILHMTSVVLFGISFIIHGWLTVIYLPVNKLAIFSLSIGNMSFISLLFLKGMWFWAGECISYSSMMLFTPLQMLDQLTTPIQYILL